MLTPRRKKKPLLTHTRLRFGRPSDSDAINGRRAGRGVAETAPASAPFPPHYWQTWESMDLSEYDPDLIELKRRAEANGQYIQIPKRGATFELPEPVDFGESLSDIVIRQRESGW